MIRLKDLGPDTRRGAAGGHRDLDTPHCGLRRARSEAAQCASAQALRAESRGTEVAPMGAALVPSRPARLAKPRGRNRSLGSSGSVCQLRRTRGPVPPDDVACPPVRGCKPSKSDQGLQCWTCPTPTKDCHGRHEDGNPWSEVGEIGQHHTTCCGASEIRGLCRPTEFLSHFFLGPNSLPSLPGQSVIMAARIVLGRRSSGFQSVLSTVSVRGTPLWVHLDMQAWNMRSDNTLGAVAARQAQITNTSIPAPPPPQTKNESSANMCFVVPPPLAGLVV